MRMKLNGEQIKNRPTADPRNLLIDGIIFRTNV
jgi:hypothetical protein